MHWLIELVTKPEAAQTIFVLCVVGAVGMALSKIRIYGVTIGIAGVLFAGLFIGNLGVQLEPEASTFAKELGLLLFVYTIGIELGPGFLGSLKKNGLKLNALAMLVVLAGVGVTLALVHGLGLPLPLATGLLTGATTNTPSLGAAQQALLLVPGVNEESLRQPGVGYALAYPLAVVGIILTLVVLRIILRVSVTEEAARLKLADGPPATAISRWNIVVRNPNIRGVLVRDLPGLENSGVVISRVLQEGRVSVAMPNTALFEGDVIVAVGPKANLEKLRLALGERSDTDLRALTGPVEARRIVVTKGSVVGKSLQSLNLTLAYGVSITRLNRGGVDLQPQPGLSLQMGDLLTVVGETDDLQRVSRELGDSPKTLDHLNTLPFFVGIALGVLVGSIPIALPGLPAAVKLGLAGGPLIVGMLLSRLSRVGPFVWYMPPNAILLLREAGIILFLACVGLKAGPGFVEALVHGDGWIWMLSGVAITIIPLVLAAWVGRMVMKLNYLTLCGVLSGSMTDPPALAYTNSLSGSNGAAVAYATVYPLTMILRVIAAQMVILFGLS
jgi:putative transport protein